MHSNFPLSVIFLLVFSHIACGKGDLESSLNSSEKQTNPFSADASFLPSSEPLRAKHSPSFALSEEKLSSLFEDQEFEQIAAKICPLDPKSQCYKPIDDFLSEKATDANQEIKLLSKGNFGVVFQISDKLVAKLLEVADLIALENAFREINTGRKVFYSAKKHKVKNLLQVANCCSELHTRGVGEDEMFFWRFFIIMPNMKFDSLRAFVASEENFKHTADFVWRVETLKSIAKGLFLLHQENYAHRDIKLDNIFMENPQTPVIGDFGFAKKFSEPDEDFVGTEVYLPPEIEHGHSHHISADIFTFGLLIFELMNTSGYQISDKLKTEAVDFCQGYFAGKNLEEEFVPKTLTGLEKHIYCKFFDKEVLRMLNEKAELRPKIKEIFKFLEMQEKLILKDVQRFNDYVVNRIDGVISAAKNFQKKNKVPIPENCDAALLIKYSNQVLGITQNNLI